MTPKNEKYQIKVKKKKKSKAQQLAFNKWFSRTIQYSVGEFRSESPAAEEPLSTKPAAAVEPATPWGGQDNTMNTGPVSISRAISLRSLMLLPLYSIQFPWQRAECCWRSSSWISRADLICYSISLQTKQARKTQEGRSMWTADGDVMWLWHQDGAVTESAPEAWRVRKNTHLMRISSCESHLLTFNPELFCSVKQIKNCPQQTVTNVTLFWRVTATSFHSEKKETLWS